MLHDMASTGIREVGTENEYRLIRVALHELAPRLAALLPVRIEGALPIGMPKLDGMMHQVAGDYRFLTLCRNSHADVTGSMAHRRLQPDSVIDPVITIIQIHQASTVPSPH